MPPSIFLGCELIGAESAFAQICYGAKQMPEEARVTHRDPNDRQPDLPEAISQAKAWRSVWLSGQLRVLEAISRFLLQEQERLAVRLGNHRPPTPAKSEPIVPSGRSKTIGLVILALILLLGIPAAVAMLYHKISRGIDSNLELVELQRDELADMKKQELRDKQQIEKQKDMLRSYRLNASEYATRLEQEVRDYRATTEDLSRQLEALRARDKLAGQQDNRSNAASGKYRADQASFGSATNGPAAGTGRTTLKKSANCAIDPTKPGDSTLKCVEGFNRH